MAISLVGYGHVNATDIAGNHNYTIPTLTGGSNSAPQTGDLVLAVLSHSTSGYRATTSSWAQLAEGYRNDTNDAGAFLLHKFMGATPDTQIDIDSASGSTEGSVLSFYVLRGVDPATPLDVTLTQTGNTNGGVPDPITITPATTGAWVIVIGVSGQGSSVVAVGTSDLSDFTQSTSTATRSVAVGIGRIGPWTSGAVDPAVFTGGDAGVAHSWVAFTVALRPAGNVYRGPTAWSSRYKGVRSDSALYKGKRTLHT